MSRKAKGRLRDKQPKLNPRQEAHLVALHAAGEHTSAELAELFGVARSTVYPGDRARRVGSRVGDLSAASVLRQGVVGGLRGCG